ncbi:MAG: hypothetical protein AAGC55_18085, partial [Myxococcota bacterium]
MVLLMILAAALAAGCGDDGDDDGGGGSDAGVSEDGGSSDGGDGGATTSDGGIDAAPVATFEECTASDESFVRNAYLAVLGRRPRSQGEVDVYAALMSAVRELDKGDGADREAMRVVLNAMMDEPGYAERWTDQIMDALRVHRIERKSKHSCYGHAMRTSYDGSLAAFVRDNPSDVGGDGNGPFTMYDLAHSALVLDDISPIYRAHLYVMITRAMDAGNVPAIQAELARREDFGQHFDATYLNRDIVCLGCHNSAFSVTDSFEPELDRHFPLPGLFEDALYGNSVGIEVERAHAPLRYRDFVARPEFGDIGQTRPWDWIPSCGGFNPSGLSADPAGVDGKFGDLTGQFLTVYDLEDALRSGFDQLVGSGLVIGDGGEIADPDMAFGYLVAAAMVEAIWRE